MEIINISDYKFIEHVDISKTLEIKNSIETTGILIKAITVDPDLKFIINGNHRASALKLLGIDKCMAQFINYNDDRISFLPSSTHQSKKHIILCVEQNTVPLSFKSCLHKIDNKNISEWESTINLDIDRLRTNVIVFGVFDLLHKGHINLLNKAKQYGNNLIVAIQKDAQVIQTKRKPIYDVNVRQFMVENLKSVNRVMQYENVYDSTREMLKKIDVFIVGEDQCNESFNKAVELCKTNNITVIRLPRTPDISTSAILQQIGS